MLTQELKELINMKCGSEAQLARKIGWKRQRLNKITNGNKVPDVDELSAIANGIGISVSRTAKFFLEK